MKYTQLLLISSALLPLVGCFPPAEPRSAVVEQAEKAGAGDLGPEISTHALAQWLARNRKPAIEIESLCKTLRAKAPVNWDDTTEGRLCTASAQVSFFRAGPITSDNRTFQGGDRDK